MLRARCRRGCTIHQHKPYYFRLSASRETLMTSNELGKAETARVVDILKRILELELAGLVRYLHYSFMIFGHNRIPIVAWLRKQADESQAHAVQAGEHITSLGEHPSLKIGPLLETHKHNVDEILREALSHEQEGLEEYRKLLALVAGRNIMLEEYARAQIAAEEAHAAEIGKMLRKPGSITCAAGHVSDAALRGVYSC